MVCTSCKLSLFHFHEMVVSQQFLINFLQEHGALPENVECPHCKTFCRFYPDNSFRFKCTNTQLVLHNKRKKKRISCNFSVSARKGTFFEKSKLSLDTICKFISLWLCFPPPRQTILEHEFHLSSKTVVEWSSFCREVCLVCMVDESEPIGGSNKIVEIDEAKMIKKKYNKGKVIEGQWVFGGIERDSKKCFLVPVHDNTKDTLLEVIQKWVLPGTTIMSDCWKSYNCLADKGFQHETVKHSKNYVDPDTGAHTQNIIKLQKNVRSNVPGNSRLKTNSDSHLAECLFRLKYSDHTDRFHPFFNYMAHAYPSVESDSGQSSDND